jgi:hypothetical protein
MAATMALLRGQTALSPPHVALRRFVQKLYRLLIDREDDASGLAHDAVARAGGIDDQCASRGDAVLVPLRAGQDDDMLIACVGVDGHLAVLAETNERGGRTFDAVAIKPVNLDTILKWLPGDFVRMRGDAEEVGDFDARILRRWVEFHKGIFVRAAGGARRL